jgi:hypothetical protein
MRAGAVEARPVNSPFSMKMIEPNKGPALKETERVHQ